MLQIRCWQQLSQITSVCLNLAPPEMLLFSSVPVVCSGPVEGLDLDRKSSFECKHVRNKQFPFPSLL